MIDTQGSMHIRKTACAGNDCSRLGVKVLKIKFINKSGFFCQVCSSELIRLKLAVPDQNYSDTAELSANGTDSARKHYESLGDGLS